MRIEILLENEEPLIFLLNKPKMIVGSHESCDICLKHDTVSRKHLIIVNENDNYFVIDQGSMNGTFINEERLVPGRKVEFNSFFPVRLGGVILITLLSDEDAQFLGFPGPQKIPVVASIQDNKVDTNDSTRAISLKDLQAAKTETLVKKRLSNNPKKNMKKVQASSTMSDKKRLLLTAILGIIILAMAIYANTLLNPTVVAEPVVKAESKLQEPLKLAPVQETILSVSKDDLVSRSRLNDIQKDAGCLTDEEKFFCDHSTTKPLNVVQVGTHLVLFFDGLTFYEKAKDSLTPPAPAQGGLVDPEIMGTYKEDLRFLTLILFLIESMPKEINDSLYKNLKFTIVVKLSIESPLGDSIVIAAVPESFAKLLKKVNPMTAGKIRKQGSKSVDFLNPYFTMY